MSVLPGESRSLLDWIDDVPPNVQAELKNRYDELSHLEKEQIQMGTTVPQLYGSLSRFIANPSTVSVETYKRMLDTDETIGSCVDFMNMTLIARFGEYKHKVPEIQEFVRRCIEQMEGSWHETLDEMLSAEWSGFSITEQVWKFETDFDGVPAFVPQKLVTYPPLTIVFAVNRHGEVLPDGIYQYQRFHNTYFNSYVQGIARGQLDGFRPDLYASIGDYPYPIRIAADLTYLTVKIEKEKVIHLRSSSTGKFQNPYGRSILRRIYKNWVLKDAFLRMWVVAADRKGTPLVVGYAAPNDTVLNGLQKDQGMQTSVARADVAMASTFKTIHNSSFVVLPGKKGEIYEVEAIQVQGDMNVFKDGVDYFNKAIMRGMLIPPLAMTSGDGTGSYALADVHSKMLAKICDGKLKPVKQAILQQWVKKIISYNFPKKMWEKHGVGDFILEEQDPELMEKLANIYGNLTTSGYMSPQDQEDMDHVREKMNMKYKKAAEPEMDFGIDGGDPHEKTAEEHGKGDDTDAEDTNEVQTDPNKDEGSEAVKLPEDDSEEQLPPNYRV